MVGVQMSEEEKKENQDVINEWWARIRDSMYFIFSNMPFGRPVLEPLERTLGGRPFPYGEESPQSVKEKVESVGKTLEQAKNVLTTPTNYIFLIIIVAIILMVVMLR